MSPDRAAAILLRLPVAARVGFFVIIGAVIIAWGALIVSSVGYLADQALGAGDSLLRSAFTGSAVGGTTAFGWIAMGAGSLSVIGMMFETVAMRFLPTEAGRRFRNALLVTASVTVVFGFAAVSGSTPEKAAQLVLMSLASAYFVTKRVRALRREAATAAAAAAAS